MNKRISIREDKKVNAWIESMDDKQSTTIRTYLRGLQTLQNILYVTPEELLKMTKKKRRETIQKFADEWIKTHTPKGTHSYVAGIQSWCKWSKKSVEGVCVKGQNRRPTIENERMPTTEDIKGILLRAGLRAKVIVVLIAFAGLRFATIRRLQINDIVDLNIDSLTAKNIPLRIFIPPNKHKIGLRGDGESYFTFLIEEGTEILLEYLRERKRLGENLTPESYIITKRRNLNRETPLDSNTVRIMMNKVIPKNLHARPYILRSYFDFNLQLANIPNRWQSFFMGHKGDIESIYTRKHLPEELIQQVREIFQRAEPKLTTLTNQNIEEQRKQDFLRQAELWLQPNELESLKQTVRPRNIKKAG